MRHETGTLREREKRRPQWRRPIIAFQMTRADRLDQRLNARTSPGTGELPDDLAGERAKEIPLSLSPEAKLRAHRDAEMPSGR
jgi:hypothetical protein